MTLQTPVLETNVPGLKLRGRGKVRDIYEDPRHPERLLIVATDRISAFDYILASGIPEKGRVLTQMTPVLARFTARYRAQSSAQHGHDGPSRRTRRPLDVGEASRNVRCRMRRARLSVGLRLERIPTDGQRCAASGCRPDCSESDAASGADFYAGHEGADRARRKHFVRSGWLPLSGRNLYTPARSDAQDIQAAVDYARPRGIIIGRHQI